MATVDVGIFRLIDPTPEQEAQLRQAISLIDYPWERLAQALADDPEGAVLVRWTDTGQGVSGRWLAYCYEIELSDRGYHNLPASTGAPFVFAHEVGHMIDWATLDDADHKSLSLLTHASAPTHRYDGVQMNDVEHEWSHNQTHTYEGVWYWGYSPTGYLFIEGEGYADQFVAAFAPTIWDGTGIEGSGSRYPRFVHWTEDHAEIRRLTLLPPPPIPKQVVMTRGVYIDRALTSLAAWRRDHPNNRLTWAKVYIAQKALRSIKPVLKRTG